jgi:hypothetical protein
MITGRIEVHPIEVRGLRFTVLLDDDGTFHAYTDAGIEAATAESRRDLASALSNVTKQALAAIRVPVTRLVDGKAWHGEVTGIHPTTRNFQVRWADGQRDQLSAIRDSNLLGGMTEAEGREWARLTEAANAAGRAIYAFREAHKTDLYAEIRAAMAAQMTTAG